MKSVFFSLMLLISTGLFAQKNNNAMPDTKIAEVWELVTVKSVAADSTITYPYGEHPVGSMILTANGRYSIQIYKADRAKIASGNKNTATPDENIMLVKGSNAHYGIYTIDLKGGVIIFKPEHAFFTNWEGQELRQNFTLQGDLLTYSSGVSTFGASRSIVVWKKK